MGAYILRRLLLVIPTLFGMMLINFALTNVVPGGPLEQIEARLEGGGDAINAISGANSDGVNSNNGGDNGYTGARGLSPEFRAKLEVQFGFARITCAPGYSGTPDILSLIHISEPTRPY